MSVPELLTAGLAEMEAGRPREAAEKFRLALTEEPENAGLWTNFAIALTASHRYGDAMTAARHAVTLRPDSVHAYNALANILDAKGKPLESADYYRRALALEPMPGLWNNLGNSLKAAGRLDEAIAAYERAIRLDPLLWRARSNLLLTLNYHPDKRPEAVAAAHREYGVAIEAAVPLARPMVQPMVRTASDRPLRVGFVSADFYFHPVGRLFLPILQARDKGKQTWLLYSHSKVRDGVSAQIRAEADLWREIAGLDDDALERQVREDEVDVLVDLSGHTATNRLPFFARHVAPTQVAWMGYAGSTGMRRMDWLIADAVTLPPAEEPLYSERVWRLPSSYICLARPEHVVEPGSPPCLASAGVTFASFNNTSKLTDAVLATWADILRAVPDARLRLKNKGFGDTPLRRSFAARFARLGIDPARLDYEGETGGEAYFRSYHAVDVALDPFPFPGLLTSLDTLWMGVPVVTMAGRGGMIGHHGELLSRAIGMPEWIARDRDDYVRIAVDLASDRARLAAWRGELRGRLERSPIFDVARLARDLGQAFEGMHRADALIKEH